MEKIKRTQGFLYGLTQNYEIINEESKNPEINKIVK